jgi:hypothetical protein
VSIELRPELFGPWRTFVVHRQSDNSLLSITGWLIARASAFGIADSGAITASVVMTIERRVYIASELPEGLEEAPTQRPEGWLGRLWGEGNAGFTSFEAAEEWAESWASEAISQGGWYPLVFPLRCAIALDRDSLQRMAQWKILGAEVAKREPRSKGADA